MLADKPNEKRKKGNLHFELSKTIKKKKKRSRPIREKNGGRTGTIQAIILPCKVSSMQTSGSRQ
jgi:hypothetical protein